MPRAGRMLAAAALSGCLLAPGGCRRSEERTVQDFQKLWFESDDTWRANRWLGVPTAQNPLDVWVTQEIFWEVKPDLVIEAGTLMGGSALLWATILDQIHDDFRVVTVDVKDRTHFARSRELWREHVTFLEGSSTDPEIVEEIARIAEGRRVLVVLDSLHTREHVLAELHAYAPLVPVGSYLVVQDSFVNGHPLEPDWGPGPYEAIDAFLEETDDFVPDRSRERLFMTYNPRGFLKRVHRSPHPAD